MDAFEYYNPVNTIFGEGKRKEIGTLLAGKYRKVLLVVSAGPFRENGLVDEIKESLEKENLQVFDMSDIDSNPHISSVAEGAAVCKEHGVECVIALGGGSTIDCSKVIAGAALTDMDPHRYLWPVDDKIMMDKALDIIAVPTMAATGTELNNTAVIMDEVAGHKSWCYSDCMFPKITLMDPEITTTVPKKLTIWGGMDILSHIFEFYLNGHDTTIFQMRFSESLIHSAMECLELLIQEPTDVRARGELMWTSVMAWGGLTKIGRGGPDLGMHGIDPGIVSRFDIHHGAALGVITPRWMRLAAARSPKMFARFAEMIMGIQERDEATAAKLGVEKYIQWLKKVECPDTLNDLGAEQIGDDELRKIAFEMVEENGGSVGSVAILGGEDVYSIYKSCWEPL